MNTNGKRPMPQPSGAKSRRLVRDGTRAHGISSAPSHPRRPVFIRGFIRSMGQSLVHLFLVEEPFLRLKEARMNHPDLLPVGAIDTKNTNAACRHAEVEEPRLERKPGCIRQQL